MSSSKGLSDSLERLVLGDEGELESFGSISDIGTFDDVAGPSLANLFDSSSDEESIGGNDGQDERTVEPSARPRIRGSFFVPDIAGFKFSAVVRSDGKRRDYYWYSPGNFKLVSRDEVVLHVELWAKHRGDEKAVNEEFAEENKKRKENKSR